jgi:hypothetical protein
MEFKNSSVLHAILDLSKFQQIEYSSQNGVITLTGLKNDFSIKQSITVKFEKINRPGRNVALVRVNINENIFVEEFDKYLLYNVLSETNILNQKQFIDLIVLMNFDYVKIMFNDFSDFAYYFFINQIHKNWSSLKNDINVKVQGERNEVISFSVAKGLDNVKIQDFINKEIKTSDTIKYCRDYRIEKLVFFDTSERMDYVLTIDEMEQMDFTK